MIVPLKFIFDFICSVFWITLQRDYRESETITVTKVHLSSSLSFQLKRKTKAPLEFTFASTHHQMINLLAQSGQLVYQPPIIALIWCPLTVSPPSVFQFFVNDFILLDYDVTVIAVVTSLIYNLLYSYFKWLCYLFLGTTYFIQACFTASVISCCTFPQLKSAQRINT